MIDKQYIQELAELLNENSLTEISLKFNDKEIILKKEVIVGATSGTLTTTVIPDSSGAEAFVCTPIEKKGKPITSPMVGTFYKSQSPNSKPFVEVGSTISEGQTVCIIEAMKLMNEIESEVNGKIVEVCIEDGQPVEFGQVLMYVE